MKRMITAVLILLGSIVTPISSSAAATTIGGLVNSDLVLTKSRSPYSLSSTLQIPSGVKVSIEAGVEVQSNGVRTMFWNQGILNFEGTREDPIRLSGQPNLYISTNNSQAKSQLKIKGVLFYGGDNIFSNEGYSGYYDLIFEDNEVKNVSGYLYVWYPTNRAIIQRNVFSSSGGLSIGFNVGAEISVLNNLFIGPSTWGYWVEVWASYGGALQVHQNEFRGGPYIAVQLKPDYGDINLNASSNYWGVQNIEEISKMVNDKNDGLQYKNVIDISNPLTAAPSINPKTSILEQQSITERAGPAKALADLNVKFSSMSARYSKSQLSYFKFEVEHFNRVWDAGLNSVGLVEFEKNVKQLDAKLTDFEAKNPIKTTITCVKGKLTKKVTAVKPVCPAGYKKK